MALDFRVGLFLTWLFMVSNAQAFTLIPIGSNTISVKENVKNVQVAYGDYTKTNACTVTFEIRENNTPKAFSFTTEQLTNVTRINITAIGPFDREVQQRYSGDLYAGTECNGNPEPQKIATIQLFVIDVPDYPPTFLAARYTASVPENAPIDTLIIENITAIDRDDGDFVKEYIPNFDDAQETLFSSFPVITENKLKLKILLKGNLDYETNTQHVFGITAVDTNNMTGTCEVVIKVIDVQDTPPLFTALVYNDRVIETAPVGTTVLKVSARDEDSVAIQNDIVYSIVEQSSPVDMFSIDSTTGEIITQKVLDIDNNTEIQNGLIVLTVMATETNSSNMTQYGKFSSMATVQIQIEDVNNNPPEFNSKFYFGNIREEAKMGEVVTLENNGYILVSDKDKFPANNQFQVHVERNGRPWSVFAPNVESQYSQGSILLILKEPEALGGLAGTHVVFQIVATDLGANARAYNLTPSVAEVSVWVAPRSTAPPASETVIDLPISTSDIIIFVVGVLLLLNVFLTAFLCYVLRGGKHSQTTFFKRNSKYYVSDSSKNRRKPAEDDPPPSSTNDVDSKGNSGANISEVVIHNAPKANGVEAVMTVRGGDIETPLVNTVAAAADRNRCDVTDIQSKLTVPDNARNVTAMVDNERDGTVNSNAELIDLMSDKDRCDLTPMKKERNRSLKYGSRYVNLLGPNQGDTNKKEVYDNRGFVGSIENLPENTTTAIVNDNNNTSPQQQQQKQQQENKVRCDIAPLDQTLAVRASGLSNLLQKVQEKLMEKNTAEVSTKGETNDEKGQEVRSFEQSPESLNSSFSERSTGDVVPLIKSADRSKVAKAPAVVKTTEVGNKVNMTKKGASNDDNPDPKVQDGKTKTTKIPTAASKNEAKGPHSSETLLGNRLTQTGVPPIALALPSSTGTFSRDHLTAVTNPMFGASVPPSRRPSETAEEPKPKGLVDKPVASKENVSSKIHEETKASPLKVTFSKPPNYNQSSSSRYKSHQKPTNGVASSKMSVTVTPILQKSPKTNETAASPSSANHTTPTNQAGLTSNVQTQTIQSSGSNLSKSAPLLNENGPTKDYMAAAKDLLQSAANAKMASQEAIVKPVAPEKTTSF